MKHLQSINEYSSEYYKKLINYGKERGDSRGKRLANTAKDLKNKFFPANEIEFFWVQYPGEKYFLKFNDDNFNIERVKYDWNSNREFFLLVNLINNKHHEESLVRFSLAFLTNDKYHLTVDGLNIELTRKSSRDLSNILKQYFDIDVEPNKLPQM
jgi:hypothetical protein